MSGEVFEGLAIALADALDEEVEFMPIGPELLVIGRFPVAIGAGGQGLGDPGTGMEVFASSEGDVVVLFFVAIDEVQVIVHLQDLGPGDGNPFCAGAAEEEGCSAVRGLSGMPAAGVFVDDLILGNLRVAGAPVCSDIRIALFIGAHGGLVDEAAILRDADGIFGGGHGDRECIGFAGRGFPGVAAVF